MSEPQRIFRILFHHQGQVVELYARQVAQGNLLGFIEVEELVFGTRSEVVVDPSEESLKSEFDGVRRLYLPLHAVIRIDEVEREGTARVRRSQGDEPKVHPFPIPFFPPGRGPGSK